MPESSTLVETHAFYHVPNRRIREFIGREDILNRVHEGLSSGPAPRIVVLRGMGGQGKTQIALEYCHRAKTKQFPTIFWVDATSESSLKKSYEVIAEDIKSATLVFPDTDSRVAFILQRFVNWPQPWLLVFDNYDDRIAFSSLPDFIPAGENGSILITTRHADADSLGQDGRAIELYGLQEGEALELLFNRTTEKQTDHSTEHGISIVKRLGYHPLAITQAGAYIGKRKIRFEDFLDHYNRQRKIILDQTPQISQYRRKLNDADKETSLSVFTTWELSFQQLQAMEGERHRREDLLTLLAFFYHKDISEKLFKEYCMNIDSSEKVSTILNPFFDKLQGDWDSDSFIDDLCDLRDLSLLQGFTREADGFLHFSLHSLVKDWIRLRTSRKYCQDYSLLAADIVASTIMPCLHNGRLEMSLSAKQEVLLHLDVHVENYNDFLPTDLVLSFDNSVLINFANAETWFGSFYLDSGHYSDAKDMFQQALKLREEVLGQRHPETLGSMYNFASVLDSQGKYDEAEAIYRQTLQLSEEVLGQRHPDTLASMNNLALVLHNQGKYDEAEAICRQTLQLREEVLDQRHPGTLASMNNLALVLYRQGKYNEAEVINRQTLQLREEVLGQQHPRTLGTMNNLALVLHNQGKYDEAEAICRQTLQLREEVLGQRHPGTLISMRSLALVLDSCGKHDEAEALYEKSVSRN